MTHTRGVSIGLAVFAIGAASPVLAQENAYVQTNLVADSAAFNPTAMVDPNLVNAWGIALRPPGAGGHIWISNARDGTTTTYIGDVNGIPLHQDGLKVIPIDQPTWTDHGYSQVTGQVYNAASDVPGQPVEFPVSGPANNWSTNPPTPVGVISGPAKFVFVTKDGTINAWRSGTNPGMTSAVVVKDYSITSATPLNLPIAPVYTGVAMTTDAYTVDGNGNKVASNRLYVADFENSRIQVLDNQWNDITASVTFQTPADAAALSPFNIQYLAGHLFVTYAKVEAQGEEPGDEVDGPGLGHVVEYDRDGHLVRDFPASAPLNAPWGLAIAPAGFGVFGGDLLVANFGDGTIAAYNLTSGAFIDRLKDPQGNIISIDGVWGLTFGNGVSLGDADSLYFTAGPNGEDDGLFGKLTVGPDPSAGVPALPPWASVLLALLLLITAAWLLPKQQVSASG